MTFLKMVITAKLNPLPVNKADLRSDLSTDFPSIFTAFRIVDVDRTFSDVYFLIHGFVLP